MKKRLTQDEQHEKMINDIIRNFNFEKCRTVMLFLGWEWGLAPSRVPEIKDMEKTARYLLDGAIDGCIKDKKCRPGVTYMNATGGFKAEAIKNKYGRLEYLQLEFILTEWDTDGDYD